MQESRVSSSDLIKPYPLEKRDCSGISELFEFGNVAKDLKKGKVRGRLKRSVYQEDRQGKIYEEGMQRAYLYPWNPLAHRRRNYRVIKSVSQWARYDGCGRGRDGDEDDS
jgi:hypothetical protein